MPRWLIYTLAILAVLLAGVALTAPLGPVPGIRIGGTETGIPDNWTDVPLPEEVRLATYDGPLPYVVTIWIVESAGRLYVIGAPESTWVEKATASPEVKLRIGDDVYAMIATRQPPGREDVFQGLHRPLPGRLSGNHRRLPASDRIRPGRRSVRADGPPGPLIWPADQVR